MAFWRVMTLRDVLLVSTMGICFALMFFGQPILVPPGRAWFGAAGFAILGLLLVLALTKASRASCQTSCPSSSRRRPLRP
jgi:hypothetical protein